jgi:hypothetical protein
MSVGQETLKEAIELKIGHHKKLGVLGCHYCSLSSFLNGYLITRYSKVGFGGSMIISSMAWVVSSA